jgi:hypothetical protein
MYSVVKSTTDSLRPEKKVKKKMAQLFVATLIEMPILASIGLTVQGPSV